jgi:hypothetical protein
MNRILSKIGLLAVLAVVAFGLYSVFGPSAAHSTVGWQRWVEPGALSQAHRHLENNCAACHSSVFDKQASSTKCILCHANNTALLQRSSTSFHANVGQCSSCHVEHQGLLKRPILMDHTALASIFTKQLEDGQPGDKEAAHQLTMWIKAVSGPEHLSGMYPHANGKEASLNCLSCHLPQDVHFGYFGKDCVQCHATTTWKIAEYRHPSPQSTECAECHKPPPSHLMGHFAMVDQGVTGKKEARVNQCFICHQTTGWNDIKGVGWYKMH